MNAISRTLATADNQRERSNDREVKNNAGGFVYSVGNKDRLTRFLILGTDGGTYYVGERELTKQSINFVRDLIRRDEALVRETVVEVSVEGRAYRNDPAVFTVVALLVYGKDHEANREAFLKVVRTPTHLFLAVDFINKMSGWGRAKRKAVAGWFTSRDADSLAYAAVKYRSRSV